MTNTEELIKVAIENGYINAKDKSIVEVRPSKLERDEYIVRTVGENFILNKYQIFCNPLFWLALERGLGWDKCCNNGHVPVPCEDGGVDWTGCDFCVEDGQFTPQWKRYWHRFIDHLSEGHSIEDYAGKLLSK